MSAETGPGRVFVAASLWQGHGTSLRPVASVGVAPELAPTSSRARAFVASAVHRPTFVVTSIASGGIQRICYAMWSAQSPTLVVYAERSIPADRQVPVETGSAFSDLDYATYLGPSTQPSDLETTDLPPRELPLSGDPVRDAIPFGDTTLTLVAAPRVQLGGALGATLPWILVGGGAVLSVAAAATTQELVRRRRRAEQGADTVALLYEQLDGLYAEERTIAETLQRALLPQRNPDIPRLEIASRYVAGARRVDIGGDWYSLIPVDDDQFAFVVGDVSGKGLSAATIMARLRFTIRAYLLEGHPPDVVLEMCSHQLDVEDDGHFATVLVGTGNLTSGTIVLANAGHLNPLVVTASGAHYVSTVVGVPLGVGASRYPSTTLALASGSILVAFTDGLVERRGESIDLSLERLAQRVRPAPTLEGLMSDLVGQVADDGSEDDVAVLAFRWSGHPHSPS
jgi:serine phosphatase RsbU (regulator of sigma subunit)